MVGSDLPLFLLQLFTYLLQTVFPVLADPIARDDSPVGIVPQRAWGQVQKFGGFGGSHIPGKACRFSNFSLSRNWRGFA